MTPKISIRSTLMFDGSDPEPSSIKYDLIVYKVDSKGRIEGRGIFDLESNQLKLIGIDRYDQLGNRFVEIQIVEDKRRVWKLKYYSQEGHLVCEQVMSQSDPKSEIGGEERNYFYDSNGERTGWETVQGFEGMGMMRTLHQYAVEKHPKGKLYKDYYMRYGQLEDHPNEYFILDPSNKRVEYGEVAGQNIVPREYTTFGPNGIETESRYVKSSGETWRLMKNELYDSLVGMERYEGMVNEFLGMWNSVKDEKYPKLKYETTTRQLAEAERRFGLRNPFLHPGHENDGSDVSLLNEIATWAVEAEDDDPGGRLLAKIEGHLRILEPRIYYGVTKFENVILAELFLVVAGAAVGSSNGEKVIQYSKQAQEFNRGQDKKLESQCLLYMMGAAMDIHHATGSVQHLREGYPSYLSLKQLLAEGEASDGAVFIAERFSVLWKNAGLDREEGTAANEKPIEVNDVPIVHDTEPLKRNEEQNQIEEAAVDPVGPLPPPKRNESRKTIAIVGSVCISILLIVILVRTISESAVDHKLADEAQWKAMRDSLANDSIMKLQAEGDTERMRQLEEAARQDSIAAVAAKRATEPYVETAFGLNVKMVYVAGGTFTMGCTGCTSGHGRVNIDDEKPKHSVTLDSYFLGATEVTQAHWKAVMGDNPSFNKGCDLCPVDHVFWDDAQKFIIKLNDQSGLHYRLPTEAEWEYAARGGTNSNGTKFSGSNSLASVSWYDYNSGGKTHPVAEKTANELGLYDMSGNVWELCQDWYDDEYYATSPVKNPRGPDSGEFHVRRGGSIDAYEEDCHVSMRNLDYTGMDENYFGIRLARD